MQYACNCPEGQLHAYLVCAIALKGNCTHCTCICPKGQMHVLMHAFATFGGKCMLHVCILPSAKCTHVGSHASATSWHLHAHFKQRLFVIFDVSMQKAEGLLHANQVCASGPLGPLAHTACKCHRRWHLHARAFAKAL